MKLLVSVRDESEAKIVNDHPGVTIIDMKEPSNGSLGAVSYQTAFAARHSIAKDRITSIALGEILDGPIWPDAAELERRELLSKFNFAKFGLSGLARHEDWITKWHTAFQQLPSGVQRVAVGYADEEQSDAPSLETILAASVEVNAAVFLIDTFSKKNGNLFEILGTPRLQRLIGIAGSMKPQDLPAAIELNPDFVAVRGAVCKGDRTSSIDDQQLTKFIERMGSIEDESLDVPAAEGSASEG
jgi:uncharacterized protein (UPF0264 family)